MRWPGISIFLPVLVQAQVIVTPQLVTSLSSTLQENSALMVVDGTVWTINDSGGDQALLQIDTTNGSILRELQLLNASNIDWEELAHDEEHVFVGDFGNNNGNRTDLRIYRLPLDSLLDPDALSVVVDTIAFSLSDQIVFNSAPQANNYDLEAMVVLADSILLFSKNWLNEWCKLYTLPKIPGTFTAQLRDSFNSAGLITCADIDTSTGSIFLGGVTFSLPFDPFIWRLQGYSGTDVFQGVNTRYELTESDLQMEGLAVRVPDALYLSNETFFTSPARLWQLDLGIVTNSTAWSSTTEPVILQDLANDQLIIEVQPAGRVMNVRLYDMHLRTVLSTTIQSGGRSYLCTGGQVSGAYVLQLSGPDVQYRSVILQPRK